MRRRFHSTHSLVSNRREYAMQLKMSSQRYLVEISDHFRKPNIICLLGYTFAESTDYPHYTDIQKGVWSKSHPLFNPLQNEAQNKILWDWFFWRAQVKTFQSEVFSLLLQSAKFIIITQNVDLSLQLAGFDIECALYGNMSKFKCVSNLHVFEANTNSPIALNYRCPICQSLLLPDVEMFGWNKKENSVNHAINAMKSADFIIFIGADTHLHPFQSISDIDKQALSNVATISIEAKQVLYSHKQIKLVIQLKEIESHLGLNEEKKITKGGYDFKNQSLQNTLVLIAEWSKASTIQDTASN